MINLQIFTNQKHTFINPNFHHEIRRFKNQNELILRIIYKEAKNFDYSFNAFVSVA